MSARKHILITNDDGIDADALPPLAEALSQLGDVDVIVPERNWSGASHSITLFRPLRVRPTKLRSGHPAYMTDGSPTDCVRLAVLGFLKHRPDTIVSGINRGANMGDDITYSGTVAAAMEGLLSNIPSIAISIGAFGGDTDYGPGASFASLLAQAMTSAPACLASCTQQVPTPPEAPRMSTLSPRWISPMVCIMRIAVP